jgi:hypothetical protein
MYAGDAVTHAGRAAAQQEAEDAGLDSRIVNEALGYQVKDAKKDHYTPQLPLAFQLQRGDYSFRAEDFPEADASQLRVLHEHAPLVRILVLLAVPEVAIQEAAVAAITTAPAAYDRATVMAQKKANTESHAREHRNAVAAGGTAEWLRPTAASTTCGSAPYREVKLVP